MSKPIEEQISNMAEKMEKATMEPNERITTLIKSLGKDGIKAKLETLSDDEKTVLKSVLEEMKKGGEGSGKKGHTTMHLTSSKPKETEYFIRNTENDIAMTIQAGSLKEAQAKAQALINNDGGYYHNDGFREIEEAGTRKRLGLSPAMKKSVSFDKEAQSAKMIQGKVSETIIQEEVANDDADEKLVKPEAAKQNHQGTPVEGWEGQVIKGGVGSGIAGHTTSGKPIYDTPHHPSHESFTHEDHSDAAKIHSKLHEHHYDTGTDMGKPENMQSLSAKARAKATLKREEHKVQEEKNKYAGAYHSRMSDVKSGRKIGDLTIDDHKAGAERALANYKRHDVKKSEEIVMDKKEAVKEHKRLVNVLESDDKQDDKEEAKKQKKELKEMKKSEAEIIEENLDLIIEKSMAKCNDEKMVSEKLEKKGIDKKKVQGALDKFKAKKDIKKAEKDSKKEEEKEDAAEKILGMEEKEHKMKDPKKLVEAEKKENKEEKKEMKKSVTWDGRDLLKANTQGRNFNFNVEHFITETLNKGEQVEQPLKKAEKEDVNDLIEKSMDQDWTQVRVARQISEQKTNGTLVKSFSENEIAQALGLTEEEAKKLLGE